MDLPPDETLNHHRLRPPGKTASVEVLNSLRPAVPRDRSSKVLEILGPAETRHIGLSSRVRQRGQWLRQGEKKPCSGITPMRSRDLTIHHRRLQLREPFFNHPKFLLLILFLTSHIAQLYHL